MLGLRTLFRLPDDFLHLPELTKLEKLANRSQCHTGYMLWIKALFVAGALRQNGLLYTDPDKPLTLTELARWVKIERGSYVAPVVALLAQCDLMRPASNGHYQICHWERYAPDAGANYTGLIKFDLPDQKSQARSINQQAALTGVTPLTLQKYTPEQRTKLAASSGKILAYLRQQSGKQFSNDAATQILLAQLFEQKVTIKQIKQVIDWKCKDWYGTDYWKFLRPQTLFGPKFNQYLLEAPPAPHVQSAAPLTKQRYLANLFNLCCGDVTQVVARAAEESVSTTIAEVEEIGHAIGH
ncbi:conserved phage C-terminal domain-containing protein [Loigolactobacillus binensis]|uniref:conserved phage C-terminal domain-containing protein n=1 Tax=Loigolactobacillus binensis TaxID=2559922 RepID=UPI001CC4B3CB|nr:conserved phage C-terminal domain-containing protein [Loigolactobacillus binensis]